MRCPHCSTALELLAGAGPDTAPYLCRGCSRGWELAQLEPDAAALWDREVAGYLEAGDSREQVEGVLLYALAAQDDRRAGRKVKALPPGLGRKAVPPPPRRPVPAAGDAAGLPVTPTPEPAAQPAEDVRGKAGKVAPRTPSPAPTAATIPTQPERP